MKRAKKSKSPGLNKNNLITACLLLTAWSFVLETFVPSAWSDSYPAFWGFMSALSPFVVAAVLAYAFMFVAFKPQYLRVGLSLIAAIVLFIFGLILGPLTQTLPPGIGGSLVLGNLFVAIYFGAAFALIAFLTTKVHLSR